MKKLISMLLALILVLSLGTVAFATTTNTGTGDYSYEVTGSYVPGSDSSETLFSVDIQWEGMSFTYHDKVAGAWDAENYKYLDDTPAYWEGLTANSKAEGFIKVTNHSNAKITAIPAYKAVSGYESAGMTFTPAQLSLASAEGGAKVEGEIKVEPNGSLPVMDQPATIGHITVTIAEDAEVTEEENTVTEEKMQTLIDQAEALRDKINDNTALKSQIGDTDAFKDMKKNITLALGQLTAFQNGEITEEALGEWYAELLTYYEAVQALMTE